MILRLRTLLLFALIASLGVPLFADTRIVHRWVLTGLPMPHLQRMLVAGLMENYIIRQGFEDEMKTQLAKYGVESVQSYMVLPPKNEVTEADLRQRIKESSLDSVLIIRPRAVRSETEEVVSGGMWVPPPGYYAFWPYWNMAYADLFPTASYTEQNVVVRVEFNLYDIKTEKLVWNGESDTVYSKDFEKLGQQYAKALIGQLKKDKVIRKKWPASETGAGSL